MTIQDSNHTQAVVEDIAECRALNIGVSGFAECQCVGPSNCAYALPFGYAFLCQHPRIEEIVANTEKEKPLRVQVR